MQTGKENTPRVNRAGALGGDPKGASYLTISEEWLGTTLVRN
ncbi:MAG: hypothetical protein WCI02_09250 [Planctomycetota bacterium]